MLTPKKKITKKELKHDPLLDTIEKIQSYYEKNSKQILTGFIVLAVAILLIWGWMNSVKSAKDEAMLADTKIADASMQGMNANVLSELELVVAEYGENDNIAHSTLELGIARMDSGDYAGARELFTRLANSSDKYIKAAGKLKLAYVAELEQNAAEAAKLYTEVAGLDLGLAADYAKLQAAYAYVSAGEPAQAGILVTELLDTEHAGSFNDEVKYLEGKLQEK